MRFLGSLFLLCLLLKLFGLLPQFFELLLAVRILLSLLLLLALFFLGGLSLCLFFSTLFLQELLGCLFLGFLLSFGLSGSSRPLCLLTG